MKTRQLGDTDLNLTTVGLGTWAIGGPWQFGWGRQDDDQAVAAILGALEAGINWIDTAPIYGLGHSEELVGKALKQTWAKPFIATKCSLFWSEKRGVINCLKHQSIIDECHASLKRLDIETIDLYQIHWPQPPEDLEQAWRAMAELKQQGKVRYLGVSNFNIEQMKLIKKIAPIDSLQPPYSMLHRQVEEEVLSYCDKNNIGVVAYSPMQRGLLTGKFSAERLASLPDDDHRKKSSEFQEPQFSLTLELVAKLQKIAEQNNMTVAQLAISWVLRRGEVTAAIVGARNPKQIKETAPAADYEINAEDIEKIETLLTQWQEKVYGKQ